MAFNMLDGRKVRKVMMRSVRTVVSDFGVGEAQSLGLEQWEWDILEERGDAVER